MVLIEIVDILDDLVIESEVLFKKRHVPTLLLNLSDIPIMLPSRTVRLIRQASELEQPDQLVVPEFDVWILESLVDHDTLRQNLQHFLQIFLVDFGLFHLEEFFLVFVLDEVGRHNACDRDQHKDRRDLTTVIFQIMYHVVDRCRCDDADAYRVIVEAQRDKNGSQEVVRHEAGHHCDVRRGLVIYFWVVYYESYLSGHLQAGVVMLVLGILFETFYGQKVQQA